MDEVLREIKALKEELKKNEIALQRLEALEKQVAQREATEKDAMKKMDAIRQEAADAKAQLDKIVRENRLAVARNEGVVSREHGLIVMAGIARSIICQRTGASYPKRFESEQQVVREFMERATLEAGAVTGSYLVPTINTGEIVDALEEVSDLLNRTDFRPDLPGNVDLSVLTARPVLQHARATVDTEMTASDPAFGQVQLRPDEGYVYFGIDNRLLQMSPIALGTYMLGLVRDSSVEGLANDLLNADGSNNYNSITGILQDDTEAYIHRMPAGKLAFSDLQSADITSVISKTLKRGRARGVWLMSIDVLGIILSIDRLGKEKIVTYDNQGNPLIWGRPVVIDEGMPDKANSAPDTTVLGFGDLATYVVGLVQGIQVASSAEDRFSKNQTTFRGVLNYDIKRKPVATFNVIRTAPQPA